MADALDNVQQIALEAYNFQNFVLHLGALESITLQSFDIQFSADVELNYGKGGEPVSYGIKQFKREAKATILADELEQLILKSGAVAYGGDLTKLPPFTVTGKSAPLLKTPMNIEYYARITKFNIGMKKGETQTEIPLEFMVMRAPKIYFE
jgi:hypothetical protein